MQGLVMSLILIHRLSSIEMENLTMCVRVHTHTRVYVYTHVYMLIRNKPMVSHMLD